MFETTIDANKVKTLLDIQAGHNRETDTIILSISTKCQVTGKYLTSQTVSVSAIDAREIIYQLEGAIKSYRSM